MNTLRYCKPWRTLLEKIALRISLNSRWRKRIADYLFPDDCPTTPVDLFHSSPDERAG